MSRVVKSHPYLESAAQDMNTNGTPGLDNFYPVTKHRECICRGQYFVNNMMSEVYLPLRRLYYPLQTRGRKNDRENTQTYMTSVDLIIGEKHSQCHISLLSVDYCLLPMVDLFFML